MNSFDFLIIYLTCGAPLGVYYFFQNRRRQTGTRLWLKTLFTFLFWLPFGFRLLNSKARKDFFDNRVFIKNNKTETKISIFQKQLEDVLRQSDLQISIFEIREIIERYVGLTLAKNRGNTQSTGTEKEIFQTSIRENAEIGAICLRRRNYGRLSFHQIQARRDFFQIYNQLIKFASDEKKFAAATADFVRLLNDAEAQTEIEKALFDNLPDKPDFPIVRLSKNFPRNINSDQLPVAKNAALQLQSLTANLSAED